MSRNNLDITPYFVTKCQSHPEVATIGWLTSVAGKSVIFLDMKRWGWRIAIGLGIVWAAPWTLLGCLLGLLGLVSGGSWSLQGRVLEFEGRFLAWLLARAPVIGGASAMTLGHTVIARGKSELERTRAHEFVHVQQYERWGPFFIPAYLMSSCWVWARGRHPYWDNPFEREAYERAP